MIKNLKIKPYQADGILLLVAISWGCTFALVQEAIASIPIYGFLFWRFLVSFLIMLIFAYRYLSMTNRPILSAGVLLGVLNFSLYAFQTYGLKFTSSSIVAFITGLNVIFVPFIAKIIFKENVSKYAITGAILATIGLWLLTASQGMHFGLGEALTLVCAVLISFHLLYTDIFVKKYSVLLLVTIQFGVVALLAWIFGVLVDGTVMPSELNFSVVLALVTTVLFATIFAFWAQASMQRFTTPTRTALMFSIEPVSASIFAYYYAGETLSTLQIAGGLVMIAGVIYAEIGGAKHSDKIME